MSDRQDEQLISFRAGGEADAAIPPADEKDLKELHECVERAKRYCGKGGVISIE
jgi:hypothetical protein